MYKKLLAAIAAICIVFYLISCNKQSEQIEPKKHIEQRELLNNIADLKKARNITGKIYNAYRISNDKYDLKDEMYNHFDIRYAIAISKNNEVVYNFYTETFNDIGFITDKNIDILLMAVENLDNLQNYAMAIKICDDAYTTNLLLRMADKKYDIKEVTDSFVFLRTMLLNVIDQIRSKDNYENKLTNEELGILNNI